MVRQNRPHKKLDVWKKAMNLAASIYYQAEGFPAKEQFGLTSQIRRSAVSVPSNIAEGLAKGSPRDKIRFLLMAQGSLSELDTQVELSGMVGYFDESAVDDILESIEEIQRLLSGLIRTVRTQLP